MEVLFGAYMLAADETFVEIRLSGGLGGDGRAAREISQEGRERGASCGDHHPDLETPAGNNVSV
jgi:hypothetical protein